ncbi:hypothetical protein B296_00044504 [Ensete ventricosum]|uniref:Uncharacterized protein n=1 Tax=Ensete ventricosum TaxID=4639 RepID=A0A426Z0I1_ENSVE|nr:hypothetical protein B296_00044504 [Ensete ventricosum]
MRFKEVPPGRSPEPRRRAIRASARFNLRDRTKLLALVRSVALVGSIEPTNAAIYLPLLNPNPDLESGLASRRCLICCRCLRRLAAAVFAVVTALVRVPESLLQSLGLRHRHHLCCRFSLPSFAAARRRHCCRCRCYSSRGQVSSSPRFYC